MDTSSGLCSATQTRQGVSMWVLPIKVRTNGKEIVANAFFDSGSEVTLCSSSLVERLEVDGPETTLTLNTINGDGKSKPLRQVSLTISSLDGSVSIELPEVYAIDKIVIRTVSVPRDQLQRYAHLRNLNLPSVDEVSLLVGANAPEAFCIEDIRKGKGKQPIAVKLPLGWSVFQSTIGNARNSLQVNLVQTDSLQQQLEDKWKADVRDTNLQDGPQMSKEDRHALDLMEGCVKFNDGHYEIPPLWRPDASWLPQNRELEEAFATRRCFSRRLCQRCSELH